MVEKFDEFDRKRVVNELEKKLKCHFSKIGNSRTLFSDNAGNRYYVLGGVDNWHGIPKELIDIRDNSFKETFLIIAKRWKTKIEIFMASIEPLIENKDKLSPTNKHYQFNIERIEENHLRIKQLQRYCPKKIAEIPYDNKIKEKQKEDFQLIKELNKDFNKLSREEQVEVLKKLTKEM